MEKAQAEDYLTSLLNKTLRIHTTDTRMFLGQFKCTDSDLNIILSQTFEYRIPPPPLPLPSTTTSLSVPPKTTTQDLTSRYLGLVVVPGEHILKIEVEEFESQMRARKGRANFGRAERERREEEMTVGEIGGGGGLEGEREGMGGCEV